MVVPELPALVGAHVDVPLVGGGAAPYTNLDFAASAPALEAVREAVDAFLPWYSSVHRGAGFKSRVSTDAYEQARWEVAAFLGARRADVVVFTRNTTDALNMLAACLPPEARVFAFASEHHANLLPWRRRRITHLPVPDDPARLPDVLDGALARHGGGGSIVTCTAASNVTGDVWPVQALASVAHRHGARIVVDAAQLAPHGPVDVSGWDVDYVAVSGHKLYAPYGAGALVGRPDLLSAREPFLAGGGAVAFVTLDDVTWAGLPERQEAGSPNVVGAVALATACRVLTQTGMERVFAHEAGLARYAAERLAKVPGLRLLRKWPEAHPRIGVLTFDLPGFHHSWVAAYLSAEHGVAVRNGCFCAQPFLMDLLGLGGAEAARLRATVGAATRDPTPGAVRLSAGLGTTTEHIDVVADALESLVVDGARWRYRYDHATHGYVPDPDDRTATFGIVVPRA